jgi:hypothetical protein
LDEEDAIVGVALVPPSGEEVAAEEVNGEIEAAGETTGEAEAT